jgi:hypothetical protein
MQIILKDTDHTYDASAKQITLVAPYTALSWGQIISIKNLTLKQVLYDHENPTHPISISGAVITHTYDNTGHQDTDILQVTIDIGGSVATPVITSSVTEEASAYESVTVADSAVGLTAGTYGDATKAEMTLETAQIRVRKDGTNPTSSEGHLVEVGDTIDLNSAADIANFKAIRTGATSGVLKVTYSE